jgi:hypothetical protein
MTDTTTTSRLDDMWDVESSAQREAKVLTQGGILEVIDRQYHLTEKGKLCDGQSVLGYLRRGNWGSHFMDFYSFWEGVRVGHEWEDHWKLVEAFREHPNPLFKRISVTLTDEERRLLGVRRRKNKQVEMADHLKTLAVYAALNMGAEQ